MDESPIRRSTYVTRIQKRRLIQLVTVHSELKEPKFSSTFTHSDSQRLWQVIASECNSLPGAKKSWKQWRKTFQDLKSKYRKRSKEKNGEMPQIALTLNEAEREVLGIKSDPEFINMGESSEFQDMEPEDQQDEKSSSPDIPKSPQEETIRKPKKKILRYTRLRSKRTDCNECMLNCNLLALQENQKIKIKEDYFNFRKDYLRQKLKLMAEQTEALKTIARELVREVT